MERDPENRLALSPYFVCLGRLEVVFATPLGFIFCDILFAHVKFL